MKHIAMLLMAALVGFAACKKETTKCWDCMAYFDKTGNAYLQSELTTCSPNEVVYYETTPYVLTGADTTNGVMTHWVCNEKK